MELAQASLAGDDSAFRKVIWLSDESPPKKRKMSLGDEDGSVASPTTGGVAREVPACDCTSDVATAPAEPLAKSPEREQGQGDVKDKEIQVSTGQSPGNAAVVEMAQDVQDSGNGEDATIKIADAEQKEPDTTTDTQQEQVTGAKMRKEESAQAVKEPPPPPDTKTDKDTGKDKADTKGEGQGARSTHKDKPTIVDQVVRNIEKVFSMLKK